MAASRSVGAARRAPLTPFEAREPLTKHDAISSGPAPFHNTNVSPMLLRAGLEMRDVGRSVAAAFSRVLPPFL
jgi:hypothetical protein